VEVGIDVGGSYGRVVVVVGATGRGALPTDQRRHRTLFTDPNPPARPIEAQAHALTRADPTWGWPGHRAATTNKGRQR
jgi:hypothetical protein